MVSVRKRIRRSLRGTRPIVTAFWCTTTVALVLLHLLTCTSFTSASHPREEKNDKLLILNKYAPPITETPTVLQDSNAASSSTRISKPLQRDTEQEQASILALLEAYNGPPQAEESSSIRKGAAQPVFFRHRKWTRSHDIVRHHRPEQPLELDPADPSYYQENILLETTTTTTTNLIQLLTKIWKDMILMTFRVADHKRSLNPAAAAPTTPTYHQIRRRRRPVQLRRKLPESNNNTNKFKNSTKKFPHTSNNDFDSDYKDPENHPPRSN